MSLIDSNSDIMTGKIPIKRLDLDQTTDAIRVEAYGKPMVSIVYDTNETPKGTELYVSIEGNSYYFDKSGRLIESKTPE
jgi:hypothetical protein